MNRKWLADLAIVLLVLALGSPVAWVVVQIRHQQEFFSLRDEGKDVILQFEPLRPADVSVHGWRGEIVTVHNAWGNMFNAPGKVKTKSLKQALAELRNLKAAADAENAVERLDKVFDLLLRYRPAEKRYIEGMREMYRSGFPEFAVDQQTPP